MKKASLATDSAQELTELLQKEEPLHPDLQPYVETAPFGQVLRHPLVFQLPYSPAMNALCNRQYLETSEYVRKARADKKWADYVQLHERPHRLDALIEIEMHLSDSLYWELLSYVWADSENLWQYGDATLHSLLTSKRPGREHMMDKRERKFLAGLPDAFAIYRGHQFCNRRGYSWTLSYWKARWFAQRFFAKRFGVVTATVSKKDVVAVLLDRGEFEIVVDPECLGDIATVKIPKRPPWMQRVLDESWAGYVLPKVSSYHGLWHWEKVERNAIALAKATPDCDEEVARLFAIIHDCKRENEDRDPKHGHRSAAFAESLFDQGKLHITQQQLHILTEACRYHNDGQVSDDPTIGVCWDADRLDLTRVGVTPDPAFLSTKAGKKLMWCV